MSQVTNVIITCNLNEDEALESINQYLSKKGHQLGLKNIGKHVGGTKVLEATIFAGAINYLDLEDFIYHFFNHPWRHLKRINLLVKEQHDLSFKTVVHACEI